MPGQQRLLCRQEQADVAAAGVERADEADDHQPPERVDHREPDAGRRHQHRRRQEQGAAWDAVALESDDERGDRRAEQGGGDDRADLHLGHAERLEEHGEHDADHAVAERAQASGLQQDPGVGADHTDHSARSGQLLLEPVVGVVLVVEGRDLRVAGAAVQRDRLRQDVVGVEPHEPRAVIASTAVRARRATAGRGRGRARSATATCA